MTSTLSPHDTGDIRLGGARDLTYLTQRPALRRPDATGEYPTIVPGAAGLADAETMILAVPARGELTRLAAGETMVLPVDATPATPRHAVATVYPSTDPLKPLLRRGKRRAAAPAWAYALLGAGALLLGEAIAGLAVLAVAW